VRAVTAAGLGVVRSRAAGGWRRVFGSSLNLRRLRRPERRAEWGRRQTVLVSASVANVLLAAVVLAIGSQSAAGRVAHVIPAGPPRPHEMAGPPAPAAPPAPGVAPALSMPPAPADPAQALEPPLPPSPPAEIRWDPEQMTGVFTRVPTDQKVAFITIDDGWHRDPRVLDLVKQLHLPVSMFVLQEPSQKGFDFFHQMQLAGATVEDHTVDHRRLADLPYDQQVQEICGPATDFQARFGARPTLFRPPYGRYNADTIRAAKACGFKGLTLWNADMESGQLQFDSGSLQPGDIILFHFKDDLFEKLQSTVAFLRSNGYTVGRLEDYLSLQPARPK
jgi:peptidoglycan/xylan/chitin deacetylase (PgdA/CDA1 family)